MSHRKPSHLSLFTKNRLITKPSPLTLGVGATTVLVAAGIGIGIATGGTSGPAAPAALNRAGVSQATSHPTGQGHRSVSARPALHDHAGHHVDHHVAAPRRPAATHQPTAPYLMYDSVLPSAIPAHHVAAVYATGPYTASPSELADKGPIIWIDVTGSDPAASALDVEPTDATPSGAASWAYQRLSKRPHAVARIYCNISEWPAVKAAVAGLPRNIQSRIRWWIADPTGVPHLVPGSDATQWYWGPTYDISTVTSRF